MNSLLNKIKKAVNSNDIKVKHNLLQLYRNPDSDSLTEFKNDVKIIYSLQRAIRKYLNTDKFDFLSFYNKYIILKNVFLIDGILYIASEYFTESEEVYEIFCSLPFYIDKIRISNRINTKFLALMEKNDIRKK